MISRRGLIRNLLAAPVIIRTPGLLMPIKPARIGTNSILLTWVEPPLGTVPMTYQVQWSADGGRTWNDTIAPTMDRWPASPNGFINIRTKLENASL